MRKIPIFLSLLAYCCVGAQALANESACGIYYSNGKIEGGKSHFYGRHFIQGNLGIYRFFNRIETLEGNSDFHQSLLISEECEFQAKLRRSGDSSRVIFSIENPNQCKIIKKFSDGVDRLIFNDFEDGVVIAGSGRSVEMIAADISRAMCLDVHVSDIE